MEPMAPMMTEAEYTEARAESQNREFLRKLKLAEKNKNKLPHAFGNRKRRRQLEAQFKKVKANDKNI